ncbi:hypothetical protein PVAP13_2KG187991 [Panicum virgatum]|uniref:BZIP domain-containing protein n=1 Tax=Panicum virgatum TaxID=38727 RepID=A0A8T0W9T2_PANVG|nr:hypothetical protein PVAP13_2KG187991 [Panicum virgatum]
MFDQMSIGGGTMSTGQGWPATPAAPEGGQYCMFDDNSRSSAWSAMPSCPTSMLDQLVTIGGGSMSMSMSMGPGQGWPETPAAPTSADAGVFDNSMMSSCDSMMFDQMNIGGGSMSMGQGWLEMPPAAATSNNYAMFGFDDINGGSSSSSSGAWASKPAGNMSSSSSMGNSTAPVPKLILGGMEKPTRMPRRQQPSLAAVASIMSPRGTDGDFFSVAEMEIINKDKRLKEIVNTDPKRVKRILKNRISAAKLRARRNAKVLDI